MIRCYLTFLYFKINALFLERIIKTLSPTKNGLLLAGSLFKLKIHRLSIGGGGAATGTVVFNL